MLCLSYHHTIILVYKNGRWGYFVLPWLPTHLTYAALKKGCGLMSLASRELKTDPYETK